MLEYRNTKLAVVEAKAWDLPLTEGVGQAKDYAEKLKIRWAYSTNGQGIYQVDMGAGAAVDGENEINVNDATKKSHDSHASHKSHSLETEVRQFPTPEELWSGSNRMRSKRKARCRRTAACFSRSSRPS